MVDLNERIEDGIMDKKDRHTDLDDDISTQRSGENLWANYHALLSGEKKAWEDLGNGLGEERGNTGLDAEG